MACDQVLLRVIAYDAAEALLLSLLTWLPVLTPAPLPLIILLPVVLLLLLLLLRVPLILVSAPPALLCAAWWTSGVVPVSLGWLAEVEAAEATNTVPADHTTQVVVQHVEKHGHPQHSRRMLGVTQRLKMRRSIAKSPTCWLGLGNNTNSKTTAVASRAR